MPLKTPMQVQLEDLLKQQAALLILKNKGTITEVQLTTLNKISEEIIDLQLELAGLPLASLNKDSESVTEAKSDSVVYVPNANEKHLYHVELTKGKRYDPNTGKEISAPYVQIFSEKEYTQLEANKAFLGLTTKVLHSPK